MMKRIRCFFVVLVLSFLVQGAWSAELGRRSLSSEGGRMQGDGIPVEDAYRDAVTESGLGVEAALEWNSLDWDVGDESPGDQAWMPVASIFYGVSDTFDIRFSAKYLAGEEGNSKITLARLGVGTKAWFTTGTDFMPFLSFLVNYYVVDGKYNDVDFDDRKGTFGVSGTAGVMYLLNEWVGIEIHAQAETSLDDAEVSVDGNDEDVSFTSYGIGIGGVLRF